jgi:hypothetical protein
VASLHGAPGEPERLRPPPHRAHRRKRATRLAQTRPPRRAQPTHSAHNNTHAPCSPASCTFPHFHAHNTPHAAHRAGRREPTRAASHGTPLRRARGAYAHSSPRRSTPRAAPSIADACRHPFFPSRHDHESPPRIPHTDFFSSPSSLKKERKKGTKKKKKKKESRLLYIRYDMGGVSGECM